MKVKVRKKWALIDFQNSSCKSLNFFITEFWGGKSVNYAMQALQLSSLRRQRIAATKFKLSLK
jgi:hypothetical protein